ncbi:MAG: HmuY family protein [Flavobacteriales bacterium]|nr:HmuY family protein [Flavobacteriales bacterium]
MRTVIGIGAVVMACAFSSCVKEELPVPKQTRGGNSMQGEGEWFECVANVGVDYANQLWFDLGTQSVVAQNSKMDWDLAFQCAPDGWQVRLNYSRLMRAHRTGQAEITEPTDTTGYGNTWKIDLPNGRPDSMAIGDWRSEHPVFVLDMGYNVIGLPMGLKKVQVTDVSAASFSFRTAKLNGSNVQEYTIQKDPARAYVHFNFTSGSAVNIAAPLGSYDMVFTQYTEQFYAPDPYLSYIVTGTVNGYSGARVAQLSGDFASITLADTVANPFSTDEDIIGYDWKDYSFDTGTYEVYSNQVYIVQDTDGNFYKLHFIDYYNDIGQRGSPKFELVQLIPE